jgi:hypothetical protein
MKYRIIFFTGDIEQRVNCETREMAERIVVALTLDPNFSKTLKDWEILEDQGDSWHLVNDMRRGPYYPNLP